MRYYYYLFKMVLFNWRIYKDRPIRQTDDGGQLNIFKFQWTAQHSKPSMDQMVLTIYIVCVSVEYIVIGKVTPYGDTTNWPPTVYCAHTMLRLMNCTFVVWLAHCRAALLLVRCPLREIISGQNPHCLLMKCVYVFCMSHTKSPITHSLLWFTTFSLDWCYEYLFIYIKYQPSVYNSAAQRMEYSSDTQLVKCIHMYN